MHLQCVQVCLLSTNVPGDLWYQILLPQIFVCVKPLFWSACQMLTNFVKVIAFISANGEEG